MKETSVYEIVTHRIITLLEKGCIPWSRPWLAGTQAPQNLVSRHPYRGINVILLNSLGYSSPFWLTYRQAQELGGHVRKGEKACPVVLWKWLDTTNKETGEKERIPLLRYYSLFNLSQVNGVPAPATEEPRNDISPIESAKRIVDGMPNRPEIRHGFNQAYYSPAGDYVGMPNIEQFKTSEDYYGTLFHELGHSTGHETRLNRKGITGSEGKWANFGSESYSKEELCAECVSSFLSAEAGITERTIQNSASYIASWIERLKSDSKLVVQAAAQATHAAEYILNRKATSETQPEALAA